MADFICLGSETWTNEASPGIITQSKASLKNMTGLEKVGVEEEKVGVK